MVELRPDRGDLNPFLSGRRLGPCEKYQNNLLLFLGGRDRRALLLSNRFETLSHSQIPVFVLFFDTEEKSFNVPPLSRESEAVRHLGKVKLLRSLEAGTVRFRLDVNFKKVRSGVTKQLFLPLPQSPVL